MTNASVLNIWPATPGKKIAIAKQNYWNKDISRRALYAIGDYAFSLQNEISAHIFKTMINWLYLSFLFDLVEACYFANPLPVELVPVVPVIGNWQERGMHVFEVSDYPIKTLLFKGKDDFRMLVTMVSEICSSLQDQQIPFNLLISECSTKIFLFPQVIYLVLLNTGKWGDLFFFFWKPLW